MERQKDADTAQQWLDRLSDPIPGFTDESAAAERELAQLTDFGVKIPQ